MFNQGVLCRTLGSIKSILNFRSAVPIIQQIHNKSTDETSGIPPKPKRPLTPYFRYMQQIRTSVREKNPNVKMNDITKLIATQWETVDENVKKNLEAQYKKEQEVYVQEKLKWDQQLTDENKQAIRQIRRDKEISREKRQYKKKCREFQRPHKAPTAFVIWLQKEFPLRGSENFRQWQIRMGEKWKSMSETEKKPYQLESEKRQLKYKEEMALWEEKMIRIGNIDIIRNEALIEPKAPKPKKTVHKD